MQNKKLKIVRNTSLAASDVFEVFLLTKRARGAKTKTAETYKAHFRAMSYKTPIQYKAELGFL